MEGEKRNVLLSFIELLSLFLKTFGDAVTPKNIEKATNIIVNNAFEIGRNLGTFFSYASKDEHANDMTVKPVIAIKSSQSLTFPVISMTRNIRTV